MHFKFAGLGAQIADLLTGLQRLQAIEKVLKTHLEQAFQRASTPATNIHITDETFLEHLRRTRLLVATLRKDLATFRRGQEQLVVVDNYGLKHPEILTAAAPEAGNPPYIRSRPELLILTRQIEGVPSVRMVLEGELDLAVGDQLEYSLAPFQDHIERIHLDLSHLTFMDCAGLGALIRLKDAMQEAEVDLVVTRGPPNVQRIFDLTHTDHLFRFVVSSGGEDPKVIF